MKIGANHKVTKALIVALFSTLLLPINFQRAEAVLSPGFEIYLDQPFVQGSYVSGSANSATETFNGFSVSPTGTSCTNATWAIGTVSNSACTLWPNNNDLGAITTGSDPTVNSAGFPINGTNFAATGNAGGAGFTVTFLTPQKYVGFWWSAGNAGNAVRFISNGQTVASIDVGDTNTANSLLDRLDGAPDCTNSTTYLSKSATLTAENGNIYQSRYYFGAPWGYTSLTPTTCSASVPTEAYSYIHAFAKDGATFDSVLFDGGNFEVDNITISSESLTPRSSLVLVGRQNVSALTFSISYDQNGGSGSTGGSSAYSVGSNFTLPSAPTKNNYTFNGWYTAASGGTRAGGGGDSINLGTTANITLYAQWTRTTYVITYDTHGGNAIADGVFESGGATTTTPADPTRSGYVFDGWFANSTGGSRITFPYSPGVTTPITLHAQWSFIPIVTATQISVNPSDLNGNNEMVAGTTVTIGGRASINAVNGTGVPDTSGKYSFSIEDINNTITPIANCQLLSLVNSISFCSFSVPNSTSPLVIHADFISNDVTQYLDSDENDPAPNIVLPPSSGGGVGGGGGGGAPVSNPTVVPQVLPGFTWNPKNIYENEAITEAQLGAEFSVPGTVTYSIPKGYKPKNGKLTIVVTFKPTDTTQYLEVQITREIEVLKVDSLAIEAIVSGEASTQKEVVVPELKSLGKIYFNTDEYFLDAKDRKYLKSVAIKAKKVGTNSVLILGHTDVKRGVDNNWLSKSRADAVSKFLKQFNIKAKITEAWYGPRKPAVNGTDKVSLAKNRRVEIYLLN